MEFDSIFKIVLWSVCVILSINEVLTYLKGKKSERWRRYIATVTYIKVDFKKRRYSDSDDFIEQEMLYSMPFVRYEYSYAGNIFESKKVALSDNWTTDYGKSSEAVVGINPGSEITIYVNPKNPKQSVLSRGYKGSNLKTLFGLLLFALIYELLN